MFEYMIKTYCYDRSDHEHFISNKRKRRKNKRRPYVWHNRHIWFLAHDLLSMTRYSELTFFEKHPSIHASNNTHVRRNVGTRLDKIDNRNRWVLDVERNALLYSLQLRVDSVGTRKAPQLYWWSVRVLYRRCTTKYPSRIRCNWMHGRPEQADLNATCVTGFAQV